ncbi:MAG: hypothetical protein ACK4PK_03835 [Alphaproteobacteria bacterium]|jgi:hypothetical protein
MARSNKKTQINTNPDHENDPIGALEKERNKLQERYDALSDKTRSEWGDAGFWGVVGGVALVADWTFLGGFGTVLAAANAGSAIGYARRARAVGRDLKEVKTSLNNMREAEFAMKMQQLKNAPQTPVNDNRLKDEFSPAAKAEIEALRDKLAKLEGQVGQLQEDKGNGLDKPKFKKPFGKKPDGP